MGPRTIVVGAYVAAAVAALWTVAATRLGWYPGLLVEATVESGPFETATALGLAVLGVWMAARRPWPWLVGGLLLIVAALEELSWGQHLIGFETPEWLRGRNYQGEANLHNLVDSELFSALLLVPMHIAFVVVPLVVAIRPELRSWWPLSTAPAAAWPSPHTTLIFCFGWGLHAWGAPAAKADSAGLIVMLVGAGLACVRADDWRRPAVRAHWLLVVLATAVFAGAAGIYRYYNTQYEIRELFVVLGLAHWLTGLAGRATARQVSTR